ncbi:MAG: hypothetical protein H6559_21525 [Lewinellaceae bacterium]|nr:hypothetical protein [Lewinellaceae bacterium]
MPFLFSLPVLLTSFETFPELPEVPEIESSGNMPLKLIFAEENDFVKALNLLKPENNYLVNSNYLYHLANIFSKLGDTILTFLSMRRGDYLHEEIFSIYTMDESERTSPVIQALEKWFKALFNPRRS